MGYLQEGVALHAAQQEDHLHHLIQRARRYDVAERAAVAQLAEFHVYTIFEGTNKQVICYNRNRIMQDVLSCLQYSQFLANV